MIKTFSFLLGLCLIAGASSQLEANLIDWNCGWGYAGLHTGYAHGNARTRVNVVSSLTEGGYGPGTQLLIQPLERCKQLNSDGFVGGAQVGYNLPIGCRFLAGIELDLGAFELYRTRTDAVVDQRPEFAGRVISYDQKFYTNALLTLCPRLGFTLCRSLFYITGGLAITDLNYKTLWIDDVTLTPTGEEFPSPISQIHTSKTQIAKGWAVGGGVEYWLGCRLSLFATYMHMDFGHASSFGYVPATNFNGLSTIFFNHKIKLRSDSVRLGFNIKL